MSEAPDKKEKTSSGDSLGEIEKDLFIGLIVKVCGILSSNRGRMFRNDWVRSLTFTSASSFSIQRRDELTDSRTKSWIM